MIIFVFFLNNSFILGLINGRVIVNIIALIVDETHPIEFICGSIKPFGK